MNTKIRNQIERRKGRISRRLDKNDNRGCDRPMMTASNIHYEIADRTRATSNGGIGAVHLLVRQLELDRPIDRHLGLLKIHLPYHESDHVLNIAYNLLAGGTCLEHLELLRNDEAYLDALGARRGQQKLFDKNLCFFYITNDWETPAEKIVLEANGRCNQENLLQQLKSGVRSLTAPVDSLTSNWAYLVMASLAWSLKAWAALVLPEEGRWQDRHREEKRKLLRMDFTTFRNAMMKTPAQILSTGRRIVYRFLAWNPWQHVFFRLLDQLRQPVRC